MSKTRKIFTALLTSAVLAYIPTSSAADKTLRVGTTGLVYPISFKQDGKLVGFDVETVELVAKEIGYKVEWVTADFAGLLGQLETGRIDTVANAVAVNDARKKKFHFSLPYSYDHSQVVAHKEDNSINQLDDLKGKTVAAVLGSNHITNIEKRFPNKEITVRPYEQRDAATKDLELRRIDAHVNSKAIFLAEIKSRNLPLKLIGEPLVSQEISFPFQKTEAALALSKEFDKAIQKLKSEGEIKALSEKYYGENITN